MTSRLHIMSMHIQTHLFNGPLSGTTHVSQYQKGKTNLDFTEARDSEWQWHQLGHMQGCTSFQTENHASTPSLSFLQAGCPSCRPTDSNAGDVNKTRESRVSILFLGPRKAISRFPKIRTSNRPTMGPIVSRITATCRSALDISQLLICFIAAVAHIPDARMPQNKGQWHI